MFTVKTVDLRPEIGDAMNSEMFMCEVDYFMAHYLPAYDKETAQAVIAFLKSEGVLKACSDVPSHSDVSPELNLNSQPETVPYSHIFASFHEPRKIKQVQDSSIAQLRTPPKTDEKAAFDPLGRICNKVRQGLRNVKGARPNNYWVRMCPDTRLQSAFKPCNHRIDACLTKNRFKKDPLHITDIIIAFEFKLSRLLDDIFGNRQQLASHVNHTMNEDPRRKFMYGITIENSQVSLWYFSRSHSIKARSFDIIEYPELFVEVMVSFFCATDEQLGFDPLVTFVRGREYIYKFPANESRLQPAYYLTVEPIFEYRSLCLTGRSTLEGTKEMVMKEVALGLGMPTEADIQKSLFSDLEAFRESPWRQSPLVSDLKEGLVARLGRALEGDNFKRFFSCVVDHHVGDFNRALCSKAWAAPDTFPTAKPKQNGIYKTVHGPPMALTLEGTFPPTHQCWLLFDDICTPLHDIPKLGEAMEILSQASMGLLLMFCAGWVHRDVSAGNILAFRATPDEPWQAKLSDLEYAKKFPHQGLTGAEPKTGTPFYMPCEIQCQKYMVLAAQPGRLEGGAKVPANNLRGLPILHTFQHDFESAWWITLWLCSARVNQDDLPKNFAGEMFLQDTSVNHGKTRMRVLDESLADNEDLMDSLPPSLQTDGGFLEKLDILRSNLSSEFKRRNMARAHDDIGSYSWIIGNFMTFFDEISYSRDQWSSIKLLVEKDLPKRSESSDEARDDLPVDVTGQERAAGEQQHQNNANVQVKKEKDDHDHSAAVATVNELEKKITRSRKRKAPEDIREGQNDTNHDGGVEVPVPSKKARVKAKWKMPTPCGEGGRVTRSMTRNSAGVGGPSTGV
ncbi:other/FunK1 protein kinase [Coprinopsis cinerea okayama7|uniref:Other/FunK1 protein kinase n=1 Tax=Coprinopsis cinerea (strain Okayama-7 / 130 / ATCC MYA-4618 / FGSC 9003) TaxID=240176 RepID=A8NAY9_COPC7|nr:other/FunK1 protein kinase [Coprinopsis cinerea okayama7\|eukprot:XP_001831991.2 other/FunK1 protein kinase [Coprinopsis cinerea okayama7\